MLEDVSLDPEQDEQEEAVDITWTEDDWRRYVNDMRKTHPEPEDS
jgi:hypothetical protein